MQLEDSGGDGVVGIFDRLMSLRAEVSSASGVPGGRIVSDALPTRDLLVLIHELEHVTLLTRPLGLLLTASGLQVSDARNTCAKLLNEMRYSLTDSSVLPQPIKFLEGLRKWHLYGTRTLMVAEVTLPILEGIALYTEGSLEVTNLMDGPPSLDLAIALEYQHIVAFAHNHSMQFTEADRAELYLELWNRMITRVSAARSQAAAYDATHRLFFGPGKLAPGLETARYFFGYLYVIRLLQTWQLTTNGQLSESELLLAANRFVGEVFALFATLQVGGVKNNGQLNELLARLWIFLQDALTFKRDDINLLIHGEGTLAWDGNKLTSREIGTASESVTASIIRFVFEEEVTAAAPSTTYEALSALNPAMNLQRASAWPVDILKYDRVRETLLLRLSGLGQTVLFEVNPEAMRKFLAHQAARQQELPAADRSFSESEWPTSPTAAELQTWLEFWPEGISKDASHFDSYLDLVKIRRVLIISGVALLDRNTPEDRSRSLSIRDRMLRELNFGIGAAIGNEWRDLRLAAELASPFIDDDWQLLGRFWEEYPDPTPDIAAWCHRAYARLLFPKWPDENLDDIALEKMGVLFRELEASGSAGKAAGEALWRFLKTAVWRPAMTGTKPGAFAETTTLDLIRATSLRLLGVPLVRSGPAGWEFDLMPLGDAASPTYQAGE